MPQLLTIPEIRRSIAERVAGSAPGLKESGFPYEVFQDAGRSPHDLEFAVGVPSTSYESNQRTHTLCRTEVHVAFAHQAKGHGQREGFDTLLALEQAIRVRILTTSSDWPQSFAVEAVRSTRTIGAKDWFFSDTTYTISHYLAGGE